MAASQGSYSRPKGKGKGSGNGNPPKPFGTAQDPKEASEKASAKNQALNIRAYAIMELQGVGFVRARAIAWREANPDAAAQRVREGELKEILQAGTEDALEAIHEIIADASHKDRLAAAKAWVEQDIGRAKQAVEVAGKDGAPFVVKLTQDDAGVL